MAIHKLKGKPPVNKLGLSPEDRRVAYYRDGQRAVGEVRQFDPITGYLRVWDYFREEDIEFLYYDETQTYRGTGDKINWTCEWHVNDDEVPVRRTEVKVTASTTSRLN